MRKFKVEQLVQCEVNVWFIVEAETLEDALNDVENSFTAPTSIPGCDYEVVSDGDILSTTIQEIM
jgi:hypothetical protein